MSAETGGGPSNEALQRAVIGPRADYYLRKWRAMDEKGKSYDWNWAACFLNVFWFAYRKMWGPMVAMGLIYVVTSPLLDPTHKTVLKIALVILIGSSFVTGSLGNRLYRARVRRIAGEADAAKRGGVSIGAALAALVVVALLSAVAGMIPAILAHG